MSKSPSSKDKNPAPVDRHAPVETQKMSTGKRLTLIGVAIFCLLIFSVTGPMTDVITRWFSGGPMAYATLTLPSGGRYFAAGSSSPSFPCSTNCMTATLVIGFDIE